MGALRKARWNKAFNDDNSENNSDTKYTIEDVVNRKATIVIEHLIQASDVAHTMQHWDVYRKWVSNTSTYDMLRTGFAVSFYAMHLPSSSSIPQPLSCFVPCLLDVCALYRMSGSFMNVTWDIAMAVSMKTRLRVGTRVKLVSLIIISFH